MSTMATTTVSMMPVRTALASPSRVKLLAMLFLNPRRALRDRRLDDVERAIHLRLRHGERRGEGQHIAESRLEGQAMLERAVHHRLGGIARRRLAGPIRHQLDADEKAARTHVTDQGVARL